MASRFEQLRNAISILAQPADLQDEWLTGQGLGADYGNDELALEFDGAFSAAADMIECGELTTWQKELALPLDEILEAWSGQEHGDFWNREALWADPRWEEVRRLAKEALVAFTQ